MIFNLTIFPSNLKKERFHFISVYIDNPGHDTVAVRPYYTELNQHPLYTRFIANQGDNRLPIDNLILQFNSIKRVWKPLLLYIPKCSSFLPPLHYYQRYTCTCYNVECKMLTILQYNILWYRPFQRKMYKIISFYLLFFFFFFFLHFANATCRNVFFLLYMYFYILRWIIPYCEKKKHHFRQHLF